MISELKDIMRGVLTFLSILMIIGGIFYLTEPKYTCVDNKMYEVKKDMLVKTNNDCLPIDKD